MGDGPPRAARADFHVALGLLLLPLLSLPVAVWLAARNRGSLRSADAFERRWARRLFALVAFDLLWGAVVAAALASGAVTRSRPAPAEAAGPRLGLYPDPGDAAHLRIKSVVPKSPAERAGLLPGEVVAELEGRPISAAGALAQAVQASQGRPLHLVIEGKSGRRTVAVTPESPEGVTPARGPAASADRGRFLEWGLLAGGLLAVAVAAVLRRAPALAAAMGALVCALAAHQGLALGAYQLFAQAGDSLGAATDAVVLASLGLLLVAALARPLLARLGAFPEEPPPRDLGLTSLRGLAYAYGLGWRVALFLGALLALAGLPRSTGLHPLSILPELDGSHSLRLAIGAVVVAPLGEELLFRGVLLPWMRGWAGAGWALAASTLLFGVVHLPYGWAMPTLAIYGGALGWARLRSSGLGAPILIHTAINAIGTLVALGRLAR